MSEVKIDFMQLKESVYSASISLIACICAMFLFMAVYFPHFFFQTDYFRLTAIALGVSMPMLLINVMITGILTRSTAKLQTEIVLSSAASCLSFSTSLLLGFFYHYTNKKGVVIVLISDIIFIPILITIGTWIRQNKP